jgi:hypothetical protein
MMDEETLTKMMRAVVMKIIAEEDQDPGVTAKVMNLTALMAKGRGGTFDSGASNVMVRLDKAFEDELKRQQLPPRETTITTADGESSGVINSFEEVACDTASRLMSMGRTVHLLGATVVWSRHGLKLEGPLGLSMHIRVVNFVPELTGQQFEELTSRLRQAKTSLVAKALLTDKTQKYLAKGAKSETLQRLAAHFAEVDEVQKDLEAEKTKMAEHQEKKDDVKASNPVWDLIQKWLSKRKLSDEEYIKKTREHETDGHTPFDPQCPSCIISSSRSRQHRKAALPRVLFSTGELSIDIAGPFSGTLTPWLGIFAGRPTLGRMEFRVMLARATTTLTRELTTNQKPP